MQIEGMASTNLSCRADCALGKLGQIKTKRETIERMTVERQIPIVVSTKLAVVGN